MPLLIRDEKRTQISMPQAHAVQEVKQNYNEPAQLKADGRWFSAGCLRCIIPRCIKYHDEEISCGDFSDFSYERVPDVCPTAAIKWDFKEEMPAIDSDKCIKCGLCANRCPIGAIYKKENTMEISRPGSNYRTMEVDHGDLEGHQGFILSLLDLSWDHYFQKESNTVLEEIYSAVLKYDSRSIVPNLLVRNLVIALKYRCAISRAGDVYTRMDAVYSNQICRGTIEIEFGKETLDASRAILDDIAVLHSRSNVDKHHNIALVVCLSLPNKRQGYFQVIKDINAVLDLKIQTISLGALLILVWSGARVNFSDKAFYVDFDDMGIRRAMEAYLGRSVNLSEGVLGIMEPEK